MSEDLLLSSRPQRVLQCYHCGNETLMNEVGKHIESGNGDFWFSNTSYMYLCPICKKITFFESYVDEDMAEYDGSTYSNERIRYPAVSLDSTYVPFKIKKAYEGTLKSKYTDSALCLIGLRRTLEMICKDKGSTARDLASMIKELVNINVLPPTLKEASDIARGFGNSAAHADDINVSEHDLNMIIEFVESVIDYIYVLPQKMEKYKKVAHSGDEQ